MAECRDCLAVREGEPAYRDGHSAYCEGHRQARQRHHGKHRARRARLRDNGVQDQDLPKTPRYVAKPLDEIEHPVRDRRILAEDAEYLTDLIAAVMRSHIKMTNALNHGTTPDRRALTDLNLSLGTLLPELLEYLTPYDPPKHPRLKPPAVEPD